MRKIKAFLIIFFVLFLLCAVAAAFSDTTQGEGSGSAEAMTSGVDADESSASGTIETAGQEEILNDEDGSGADFKNSSAAGAEDIDKGKGSGASGADAASAGSGVSGAAKSSAGSGASEIAGQAASSAASGTAEGKVQSATFDISKVPPYSGSPATVINDNVPFFTADDMTTDVFENYSNLDSLGRCGTAFANICTDLMPTEPRGEIGMIRPSGWHTVKYNGIIDGNYLYNRCHLIAYELAGENANEKNLITGTRYMNVEGMLPYENDTKDYVERTGHHVLYRVTPVFEGGNLVASGVLMEAHSVEDDSFYFCVYCYNVQPGIIIDYTTGDSEPDGSVQVPSDTAQTRDANLDDSKTGDAGVIANGGASQQTSDTAEKTYVLNKNTKKFHYPECPSADDIKPKNKEVFTGDRQTLINRGYDPCKRCNP